MPAPSLFERNDIVGVFRGFREGGLEFHADVVLPYRSDFQRLPMHGQHVLVQLETPDEAVLGRITAFASQGKLSSGSGEEFNIRAVQEERAVPEDLREQYLRYSVNIRVLGVVRRTDSEVQFVPSHRRLPHVGSPVAFPSGAVLQELAGHNVEGATIGLFALGEYIYGQGSQYLSHLEDWVQVREPAVEVKFPLRSLVSRRSFIFARAGFGKSNLNKLLFSQLYRTPPVIQRLEREIPVGTVIFDPDGEYFWPDYSGRPGLADVPDLEDKLVVFTPRRHRSPFYQAFVAGGIRLDLRRLRPSDVIAIAIGQERQDQQNIRKLRGLTQERWQRLVEIIDADRNQTSLDEIGDLLDLDPQRQEMEALAARANMTAIVTMLHDRSSQFLDLLLTALRAGKLCVVDVSQMRSAQSLVLSGLILKRIFDNNQAEFTNPEPEMIPTIAVVEEAQAVLNERATASEPYIAWVKEGRKYDLGSLLITQQPGSIPTDILSQGDNWFIFHLLSSADLANVKNANAHFSNDLLSTLLNEPIPGQGVFWSSVAGKPYPIAIRALSFERMFPVRDKEFCLPAAETFARQLRAEWEESLRTIGVPLASDEPDEIERAKSEEVALGRVDTAESGQLDFGGQIATPGTDVLGAFQNRAIRHLQENADVMRRLREEGVAWGELKALLRADLPHNLDDADSIAYRLVPKALNEILGRQDVGWHTFRSPRGATWAKAGTP